MTPERAAKIYDELNQFQMTLARDPVSLGPKYLQDCIATLRNWTNRVSLILMEVHQERSQLTSELNALEGAYEIDCSELLAGDERVTSRANIKDREATIKTILREQLREIHTKKREIADLTHVEKAIRHRHREIRDTITEVREQRALIRAEIDTGAMYGDERPSKGSPSYVEPILPDEDIDEEELQEILDTSGLNGPSGSDEVGPEVVVHQEEPKPEVVVHREPETASDEIMRMALEAPLGVPVTTGPSPVVPPPPGPSTAPVEPPKADPGPKSPPPSLDDILASLDATTPTPDATAPREALPDEDRIQSLLQPAVMDDETKAFLAGKPTPPPVDMSDEDLSFLLS